jgi:hypothetical protein
MPSKKAKTIQERLRYWRRSVIRLSQGKLLEVLKPHLAKEDRIAVSTLSYYERRIEPRASFLAALKRAFPDLNLDWLLTGQGQPTLSLSQMQALSMQLPPPIPLTGLGLLAQSLVGTEKLKKELPEAAFAAVTAFLKEVNLSSSSVRKFTRLLLAPLHCEPEFLGRDLLIDKQVTTYTIAYIAAIRPLVGEWGLEDFVRRIAATGR